MLPLGGEYEERPEATLPRARIHRARGEPEVAAVLIERHLRQRGRGLASTPLLSLLVEIELERGAAERAYTVAEALAELGAASGRASVSGLAALSQARVAVATGADPDDAFDRALVLLAESGLSYELARARLELAGHLTERQPQVARAEARAALDTFQHLGATRDSDIAAALLRSLGDRVSSTNRRSAPLTPREGEVLQLLAEGLTNVEIAKRLYISRRTAEHHVSSILSKLGVTNRTEAAAHVLRSRVPDRTT